MCTDIIFCIYLIQFNLCHVSTSPEENKFICDFFLLSTVLPKLHGLGEEGLFCVRYHLPSLPTLITISYSCPQPSVYTSYQEVPSSIIFRLHPFPPTVI